MSDVTELPAGINSFTTGITAIDDATTSTRAFNTLANSGQVTLDPETGERLIKALDSHIDEIDSCVSRAGSSPLGRFAPLGANPVSNTMREIFSRKANGEAESFMDVLTAYRTAIGETRQAVSTAITNFQRVDADHAVKFTKIY